VGGRDKGKLCRKYSTVAKVYKGKICRCYCGWERIRVQFAGSTVVREGIKLKLAGGSVL
jgi:hypothetical protein